MKQKNEFSRKDFLRTAGSTALFATLGIGIFGCGNATGAMEEVIPPTETDNGIEITDSGNTITLDLSNSNLVGLKAQGGWLLITEANTLVVNVDGSIIRSFTSVCTHAGCSDKWQFSNNLFECTCHNSRFDTSGRVTRGPATSDLNEFSVVQDGDTVTIKK